ncbi:MAG: hypothetical protein ACI9J3_003589, partial [Parvicellaceae bacterium]
MLYTVHFLAFITDERSELEVVELLIKFSAV